MYGVENRFKMQLLLGLKRAHCETGIQQIRTIPLLPLLDPGELLRVQEVEVVVVLLDLRSSLESYWTGYREVVLGLLTWA